MSQKKVIELVTELDPKGLNQLDAGLKKVDKSAKEVEVQSKKTSKSLKDVGDNGGAISTLDSLTGGLATRIRDAAEASKLFSFNLKGVKTALVATGIGAFVVALGVVVAYWEDIKDFITGSNKALERQLDYYAEMGDIQQRDVDLLNKKDNILKLQGKSQLEINKLKEKELEDVIKIRQQELELAKQRLQEIEDLKTAGGSSLEQIARFSQALIVNLGNQIDNFLGRFGLKTKFTESVVGGTNSIIEGIFGTEEDLKNARDRVNALEDEILSAQNTIAGFQLAEREGTTTEEQVDRPRNLEAINTEGLKELEIIQQIENAKTEIYADGSEQRKLIAEAEAEFQRAQLMQIADVTQSFGRLLQQLGEENKALAVAGIIVEQIASSAKIILSTTEANAKAVAASPLTAGQPWVAINTISAGLGIAAGTAAAVKAISKIGGGGSVTSDGGVGNIGGGAQAPSFNVVGQSGVNQLADTLNQEQQPIQAFVVGSQVTTQQELDNNIVNTANIG